jgi:hypothetical protein
MKPKKSSRELLDAEDEYFRFDRNVGNRYTVPGDKLQQRCCQALDLASTHFQGFISNLPLPLFTHPNDIWRQHNLFLD